MPLAFFLRKPGASAPAKSARDRIGFLARFRLQGVHGAQRRRIRAILCLGQVWARRQYPEASELPQDEA